MLAANLIERQVDILRAKNQRLEDRLSQLLETARENEKRRPIVFSFLTHRPRPKYADRIIFNRRIRLHIGENCHHNLFGALALRHWTLCDSQ